MKDDFGNRMKTYEKSLQTKITDDYACIRIDGRSFSKFTRLLAKYEFITKPRDLIFEQCFITATKETVAEFNFALGFHQSDEISLFFKEINNEASEFPFDGKTMKLASVVASYFTARFMEVFFKTYGSFPKISFDARVIQFPNKAEAVNMLVWRYQDARRNLIQDIAHHKFGHKKLDRVSTKEKFKMIGSPELKPGNFIKSVKRVKNDVIRNEIKLIDVDFDNLSWEERVNLVYGDYAVEKIYNS